MNTQLLADRESDIVQDANDCPPAQSKSWSEQQVQNAVYIHCALKNHEIIVPNSCLLGWESDVISVNRTGFIAEFEIKVSRADFKADAKKARTRLLVDPIQKSSVFGDVTHPRPNYFYYAVPSGLIQPEEVPEYAGLIYIEKHVEGHFLYYGTTSEIKPAKRLHKEKINEWQLRQLTRAVNIRYWRQRLKRGDATAEGGALSEETIAGSLHH